MSVRWVSVCAVALVAVPLGNVSAAPRPSRDRASSRSLSKAASAPKRKKARRRTSKRRSRDRWPPMTLVNANRRKNRVMKIRIYDRRGRARKQVSAQLARFLRCRRTGRRHRVHWRLIQHLYRISRRFPGKRIHIYSGYRHRSVSRLAGSYHTKGRAIDFRVEGVSTRKLRDYLLKRFKNVGVGYYTKVPFVHFDVRARSAFWIDFSGAGEAPRYASNARRLLARERRGIAITERRHRQDVAATAKVLAKTEPKETVADDLGQIKKLQAFPHGRSPADDSAGDDLGDHGVAPAPLGPAPRVANRH